eukprot:TRINITY_DN2368_c0_g1_i1.p1 TRINITY_DN2368_c0_g1~~TRINITY_DN2368_c0_g1_i1.p1  ORF type:complete len:550 (+),score=17.53 TRINITY_DN2368_c0_g1_i1:151-1650(+)
MDPFNGANYGGRSPRSHKMDSFSWERFPGATGCDGSPRSYKMNAFKGENGFKHAGCYSLSPRAMTPRAMSPRAMSPRAMSPHSRDIDSFQMANRFNGAGRGMGGYGKDLDYYGPRGFSDYRAPGRFSAAGGYGVVGGPCVVPSPSDPMECRMLRLAMYGMRPGNPDLESEEQLTLYHATTEDNLSAILRDGFYLPGLKGYRDGVIYLSQSIPQAERQWRAGQADIVIECSVLLGRVKTEPFSTRDCYNMDYCDSRLLAEGFDSYYFTEQGDFMIPVDCYDQIHVEAVIKDGRRCTLNRPDSSTPFLYQLRESRRGLRQLCIEEQHRLHALQDEMRHGQQYCDMQSSSKFRQPMSGMSPRSGQWGGWQSNGGMQCFNEEFASRSRDIMESYFPQKQRYLNEQIQLINEMHASRMHRTQGLIQEMGSRVGPPNRHMVAKYEGFLAGDNPHEMKLLECFAFCCFQISDLKNSCSPYTMTHLRQLAFEDGQFVNQLDMIRRMR